MSSPTLSPTALDEFEHDAHRAAYEQCLEIYHSMMNAWYSEIQHAIDIYHPSFAAAEYHQRKQFQTWIKASTICAAHSDAFMSITIPSPTSDHTTTSHSDRMHSSLSDSDSDGEGHAGNVAVVLEDADDESDEESDVDPDELALRTQRRQHRHSSSFFPEPHTPPPSHTMEFEPDLYWEIEDYTRIWHPDLPQAGNKIPGPFPSIVVTAPTDPAPEPLAHTSGWIPLQNARDNLTVPGCFTINEPSTHPELDDYEICEEARAGCVLTALCKLSIDAQREKGLHGLMFGPTTGNYALCVCSYWKDYQETGGSLEYLLWEVGNGLHHPHHEEDVCPGTSTTGTESESDASDSDSPRTPPTLPVQVSLLPEEPVVSLKTVLPVTAPPSPRWADLEDDGDELPDLAGW